jgi:hypothetical protein
MGDDSAPLLYDLEEFQMPAALRRVIKQTKLSDVVEIVSKKPNKLLDNLPDSHNVFDERMAAFKDKITITVKLVEIQQKSHLFKVVIAEKIERLQFLA